MSTQTNQKTSATTTVASATSENPTKQLKEQFSNLFGFFTKVSTDATKASTSLTTSVTEKGFTGLLEALNKKVRESKPAHTENNAKTSEKENSKKEKEEKGHQKNKDNKVKPTEKENTDKDKGDKSHREKTPQQTLKEAQIHLQPPVESKKPSSAKDKSAEPPASRYNSLGDIFGSLTSFISHAATSIQTGSSNVFKKLETGIDINARVKQGFRPTLIKGDTKKVAVDKATKKRLEEAKKMKENFEKQLRSLDHEIAVLEKRDDSNAEDGSNRSKQNDRQPKKFRISGQKSFRESSDKSIGAVNQAKPGKKVLAPLEDGKHAGKKWQEGEHKVMKTVSSQPLYLRMEKEFMQNVIFPELEARKEKLKLKREFYKPMDDKELREHALKYEERKKNMVHLENDKAAPLHFVKSNAYKRVLEQEKDDKVKADQKAEEKKQLKDKAQQYAKLVKEMFFPKSDPKDDLLSKENLQDIIARSQKAELPVVPTGSKESNNTTYATVPKLQQRKKRGSQDITENLAQQQTQPQQSPERNYVPHNYLKKRSGPKVNIPLPVVKKEQKEDMILPKEETEDEQQTEVRPAPAKKKYEPKPRMTSVSPKKDEKLLEKGEDEVKNEVLEPEMVKKTYPNYLVEVRNKRIEQEKKTGKGKYGQWEKVLKNKDMSQQEKMMNIMDDINRLEAQAKKKEGKLKRHHPIGEYQPLELEDEVGEMYLETIKAKLAIIKDLAN